MQLPNSAFHAAILPARLPPSPSESCSPCHALQQPRLHRSLRWPHHTDRHLLSGSLSVAGLIVVDQITGQPSLPRHPRLGGSGGLYNPALGTRPKTCITQQVLNKCSLGEWVTE